MAALSTKRALGAILLVVLVAAAVGASARGTGRAAKTSPPASPTTLRQVAHDTSAPLSSAGRGPIALRIHAPMLNEWRERVQTAAAPANDPVVQRAAGSGPLMPAASRNFAGLALSDAGGADYLPPDPTGDVSDTQFLQAVNGMYAVYTKTGSRIAGPVANLDFWSGLGHCGTLAAGDPTVVYDGFNDRWVVGEFAFDVTPGGDPVAPYYQCVAVSTTEDATGTWNRYEFLMNDTIFPDYPKLAVWSDGYYMSVNEFDSTGFVGAGAVAFQADRMRAGLSAQAQYIDVSRINPSLGGILPADADGSVAPAAGAPAPFIGVVDDEFYDANDRLQIWNFHVDWLTPGNSTFTLGSEVPVSPVSTAISDVYQPGHSALDAIGYGQMMYRLQWRNLGGTPTMVANHTVVGGAVTQGWARAGIRWYMLSDNGVGWTLAQEGTYSPADDVHRWMGSIAMDAAGDVALGFSATGETAPATFPSLRYVGRLATDPAGSLAQTESTLVGGGGNQSHSSGRWGDYSELIVDPSDDCTFWFTGEYMAAAASNDWKTRIGSFRFPGCSSSPTGPLNTAPPAFAGSAIENLTLTASPGSWSSGSGISGPFTYQWRRCDGPTGLGCTDISGATASTYTVRAADIGSRIRVRALATDASGTTPATSIATPVVVPQPPVNLTPPAVSGTVAVGNYLAISNGTWQSSVPVTYSYRWERCNSSGASCVPVTGVTSSTFLLDTADVGSRIRGVTVAANAGGAASANAATTIVVPAPPAPANTAPPTVSGASTVVGSTLTGAQGTWTGAGTITYTREWQRCDSTGSACAAIAGATGPTYVLTGLDAASKIRFAVTATNGGGPTTAKSDASATVTAPVSDGSAAAGTGGSGSGAGSGSGSGSGSGGSGGSSGGSSGGGGAIPPDLAVSMYGAPTPTDVGATLTYYVTVANTSLGGSSGVYLDFTLPQNVTVTSTYADRGAGCIGDNKVLTCSLDFIPAKTSANVTIAVKVTAKGQLAATASARSSESDSNPANNTASSTIGTGTETSSVPSGLNGSSNPAATADRSAPSARALSSSVRAGKSGALRFKVYDDRGNARAVATVKRGGKVVATVKSGFGPVAYGTVYYLPWKAPSTTGSYAFCVYAVDRAGNTSKSSCAPLSVR